MKEIGGGIYSAYCIRWLRNSYVFNAEDAEGIAKSAEGLEEDVQ